MFLTITLYDLDGVDHYKVHVVPEANSSEPTDVTDQYEISSIEDDETGQTGFVVMPKRVSIADDSSRSATGADL